MSARLIHANEDGDGLVCCQCGGEVRHAVEDGDGDMYCGPCLTQVYRSLDDVPAEVRGLWLLDPGATVLDTPVTCHWCGRPVAYLEAVRPLMHMERAYHPDCRKAERAGAARVGVVGVSG